MGKRAKPEEIIARLREIEVRMGRGETASAAARAVGVTEQTYYRLCKEYGLPPGAKGLLLRLRHDTFHASRFRVLPGLCGT